MMLEKPALEDEKIVACLRESYGLAVSSLTFLPIGADAAAGVYRVLAQDQAVCFLKVRNGIFEEAALAVPKFLSDQGIQQIIAPIMTASGQLQAKQDAFHLVLYPYIDGENGFESPLIEGQWAEFGRALKAIHSVKLPMALMGCVQCETFSSRWRNEVLMFLDHAEKTTPSEPVAARLAEYLRKRSTQIRDLVERAATLSAALQASPQAFVLCHSDIHAGNVLVGADGRLYIVDWDNPIMAPKERDLMFIGGGVGSVWNSPEEEAKFYAGYGQAEIDPVAMVYYRYERIVEDIAAYCAQLFLTDGGGEDRESAFRRVTTGQFAPGSVLDIAYKSERRYLGTGNPPDEAYLPA